MERLDPRFESYPVVLALRWAPERYRQNDSSPLPWVGGGRDRLFTFMHPYDGCPYETMDVTVTFSHPIFYYSEFLSGVLMTAWEASSAQQPVKSELMSGPRGCDPLVERFLSMFQAPLSFGRATDCSLPVLLLDEVDTTASALQRLMCICEHARNVNPPPSILSPIDPISIHERGELYHRPLNDNVTMNQALAAVIDQVLPTLDDIKEVLLLANYLAMPAIEHCLYVRYAQWISTLLVTTPGAQISSRVHSFF